MNADAKAARCGLFSFAQKRFPRPSIDGGFQCAGCSHQQVAMPFVLALIFSLVGCGVATDPEFRRALYVLAFRRRKRRTWNF